VCALGHHYRVVQWFSLVCSVTAEDSPEVSVQITKGPLLRHVVLKRVDVTSPRLNRINSILIPLSCNFFSGSPSAKNSRVKRAWPVAISGWVTGREVFPGAQSEDKSTQKRLGLVCRARL
jgi:hypothetical protein